MSSFSKHAFDRKTGGREDERKKGRQAIKGSLLSRFDGHFRIPQSLEDTYPFWIAGVRGSIFATFPIN